MSCNSLQYRLFVIDEEPYCLWGWDLQEQTQRFLEGLDPMHYKYLSEVHGETLLDESLSEERRQYAALAIRTAYSQGLETLFALLGATIQAPRSVPAWLSLYRVRDLVSIVTKIRKHHHLLSVLPGDLVSWQQVSEVVHTCLVFEDKDKESRIKSSFGRLWARFASQFLDQDFRQEYNSIKHGLRVRPGGFYLAFGVEKTPGVPAAKENRRLLGHSDFGSAFWVAEKVGEPRRHLQLNKHSRNWNPEDLANGLCLIAASLSNIVACLKILNGVNAEGVQFAWCDDEAYTAPWEHAAAIGVQSFQIPSVPIPVEYIREFTKEEILAAYKADVSGSSEGEGSPGSLDRD